MSLKEKAAGIDFEAILVDNASTDGSREFIAGRFPWTRIIRNEENRGFGRANNQALGESRGDYVLFLNTDFLSVSDDHIELTARNDWNCGISIPGEGQF